MTKQAIGKLNEKQQHYCETLSALINRDRKEGRRELRERQSGKLWGYLHCLMDMKVISSVEAKGLFLWYSDEDRSADNTQESFYICYETMQRMTKHAWENYYNYSGVIDKKEYPDFTVWWADMRKSGVIEAVQDKGDKPWHTEVWTDEDLVNALEYRCFPVTSENISKLRDACRDLFDDLSGRNEQIDNVCVRLFTPHNTQIDYLYRDDSNYKVPNHAVVKGEITDTQIKEIMDCLDGGEYFIPSQVGLPEEKFSTETEDDHPWFELQSDGFTITDKPATETLITVEELVQNFLDAKGNWKEDF